MGVLPSNGLIQVGLFLLVTHVFIEALRHDSALEGFLVVLEGVRGRINEVFVFTEHAEVTLGVLVEADTILEVDCVLGFTATSPRFALFFSGDTLTDILIDELGELSVVSAGLALIQSPRQDLTLFFIGSVQLSFEELLLDGSLEIAYGCRNFLHLAHSAHIAYLHCLLYFRLNCLNLLFNYK